MEASLCTSPSLTSPISIPQSKPTFTKYPNQTVKFTCTQSCKTLIGNNQRLTTKVAAIHDVSAVADPALVDITWQIVVGAIAGVTPSIVAGVEFSKRIIAQRRCEECGGSGLFLGIMITLSALDVVGFFHGSHGKNSSLVKS